MRSRLIFFIGLTALSLGSLIYLADRPPESTYFVRQFLYNFGKSIHGNFQGFFGYFHQNLASFFHSFAFTMITGSFVKKSRRACFLVALFWFVINLLFEVGQYFDKIAVRLIPDDFNNYPFLRIFDDYFITGVFDFWDIVAISAGAIVGYWLLIFTNRYE